MHNWVVERDELDRTTELSCTGCSAFLKWLDLAHAPGTGGLLAFLVADWLVEHELNSPCKET